MFWLGCSVGGIAIVLLFAALLALVPRESKVTKRHLEIVEEQLRVFNERMLEERRLACALEKLVEHVTSTNTTQAEICPHYVEATDGVHCVIVGRCTCAGKLSAVR